MEPSSVSQAAKAERSSASHAVSRRAVLPLRTTRGALLLYGALLVLPTLVFGWLYWLELQEDYQKQLDAVPEVAQDGARRIVSGMRDRLGKLIETESARPFTHYGRMIHPEDAFGGSLLPQSSPIVRGPTPAGILAWFTFNRQEMPAGEIEILVGEEAQRRGESAATFSPSVEGFRRHKGESEPLSRLDIEGMQTRTLPLAAVAVHLGQEKELECLKRCSAFMADRVMSVAVSDFKLEFFVDEEGRPRAIASRRVLLAGQIDDVPPDAACLKPLLKGFGIQQGFLIDVNWLLKELPWEISFQVLDVDESLRVPPQALPFDEVDTVFASFYPVQELGFGTARAEDELYGRLEVLINTDGIKERFESQSRKFLGVAAMLVLTLFIGMTLLYRSVNRELEQAHRIQNFVAAVTHELRTPLSTIRLYAENLLEGYVSDREARTKYYREIVRASDRLSLLVERVLEKSRLKEEVSEPVSGDLNQRILELRSALERGDGAALDLAFDLAPRLPRVWMIPEGVPWILANLVENARKYAPVPPGGEPIVIRTRFDGERVLLEVIDRGPGVPASERERVFEAFYRVGSEATRSATGTGLGLHLVQLHAAAVGALASVHDREGGGSIFRVAFRPDL